MANAGVAVKALVVAVVAMIAAAGQEQETMPRTPNLHPAGA